jgi:hypothetical protein
MSWFEVELLNEPGMAQTVSVVQVAGAGVGAGVTAGATVAWGAGVGATDAGVGVAAELEQAATKTASASGRSFFPCEILIAFLPPGETETDVLLSTGLSGSAA